MDVHVRSIVVFFPRLKVGANTSQIKFVHNLKQSVTAAISLFMDTPVSNTALNVSRESLLLKSPIRMTQSLFPIVRRNSSSLSYVSF